MKKTIILFILIVVVLLTGSSFYSEYERPFCYRLNEPLDYDDLKLTNSKVEYYENKTLLYFDYKSKTNEKQPITFGLTGRRYGLIYDYYFYEIYQNGQLIYEANMEEREKSIHLYIEPYDKGQYIFVVDDRIMAADIENCGFFTWAFTNDTGPIEAEFAPVYGED